MHSDGLTLIELRELLLNEATGRSYLSAASGMWVADDTLYVVPDDDLVLGVFSLHDSAPGQTLTIIPGALPQDAKQRKAAKPDFESLTFMPPCSRYAHGALLALGSGSTQQRKRGMLWPFAAPGTLQAEPLLFALQPLYQPLEQVFVDLNIEGVVIQGDCLKIWQRGNNQHRDNAVIEFKLADLLTLLDNPDPALSIPALRIDRYELGEVAGVPLTFTDGFALPDGACLFSAAAENTDDSYHDGECVAAAIGLIDADRQLRWIKAVQPVYKIEGISAKQEGERLQILLVSDADNPNVPAKLFKTYINYPL